MSEQNENTELRVINGDMGDLMQTPEMMQQMVDFATMMAKSRITVPAHLQGNASDCLAVVVQAVQWRMNPFSIAQKTFIAPGQKLGYEAQLVSAVLHNNAPLERRLQYEFFGDWDEIIGHFEIKKNANGKEYAVPNWEKAKEKGVGVTVIGKLKGEDEPRAIDVLLMQCHPRNSTLWATDPQQQITYAATQKWARRYFPDAILGVYSELDSTNVEYRDMGTVERVDDEPKGPAAESTRSAELKDKMRAKNLKALIDRIERVSTPEELERTLPEVRKAYKTYNAAERVSIDSAVGKKKAEIAEKAKAAETTSDESGAPPVTAEQLIKIAEGATDQLTLDEVADMARDLKTKAQKDKVAGAIESARARIAG